MKVRSKHWKWKLKLLLESQCEKNKRLLWNCLQDAPWKRPNLKDVSEKWKWKVTCAINLTVRDAHGRDQRWKPMAVKHLDICGHLIKPAWSQTTFYLFSFVVLPKICIFIIMCTKDIWASKPVLPQGGLFNNINTWQKQICTFYHHF